MKKNMNSTFTLKMTLNAYLLQAGDLMVHPTTGDLLQVESTQRSGNYSRVVFADGTHHDMWAAAAVKVQRTFERN